MKNLTRLMAFATAAALPAVGLAQQPELDLAVLYAGADDNPRNATWLEFLQSHVQVAKAIPLTDLTAEAAAGYDVVVVDTPSPFRQGGGFEMPRAPELSRDFTVPTILLGAAGGAVLQKMKLKLDWL